MLIWARAVMVGIAGPPGVNPGRALVLRSRCRLRSTLTRRRATPARMAARLAVIITVGRLSVGASGPGGGDDGGAGSGEGDRARVDGLAGPLSLARGDGDRGGGAGRGAGQFDGYHPGGVLLGDQPGGLGAEHRAGGGPGAADRGLGFLQAGF